MNGPPASPSARRRLMAARIIAVQRWPYVSTMLFSLSLVEVPCSDLPTIGVDRGWRLYYCAEFIESCSPETLATVLLHECQHLMLEHSRRFDHLHQPANQHTTWNAAGDAVINATLDEAQMPWADVAPVRYADLAPFGVVDGMTTEAAYFVMLERANAPASPGDSPEDTGSDMGTAGTGTAGMGSGNQQAEGGTEDQAGETAGDPDSATGDGTRPGGTATGGPASEREPGGMATGGPAGQGAPGPPIPDCGSAADGTKRGYELDADDQEAPAVGQAHQDVIRDKVAQDIVARSKAHGDVPAGLLRWADELFHPTIDWRKVLASLIRSGLASVAGRRDFTYRYPSRRAEALRVPLAGAILPAMRQPPPPRVAVVLDTSGSISHEDLRVFASEVLGMVRSVGFSGGFVVIPCDAQAYPPIRIRRKADVEEMKPEGGGGTDMGRGLAAAVALRPRPDVIVVFTDGYTPWPTDPPGPRVDVIVALADDARSSSVPAWASQVIIEG